MKKKIILLIFLVLPLLFSCVVKKDSKEITKEIRKDSIHEVKEITKVEEFNKDVKIESPCDSLGRLKPFSYSILLPQGKLQLWEDKGSISGKVNLKGYENILETKYKVLYDKKVSEIKKTTVIYKTPIYHWFIHIICGLVIFLLIKKKLVI
jgi:hypothetical protein